MSQDPKILWFCHINCLVLYGIVIHEFVCKGRIEEGKTLHQKIESTGLELDDLPGCFTLKPAAEDEVSPKFYKSRISPCRGVNVLHR